MNTSSRCEADLRQQLVEQLARRARRTAGPAGPRAGRVPRRRTSGRRRRCRSRTRPWCGWRAAGSVSQSARLPVERDEVLAAICGGAPPSGMAGSLCRRARRQPGIEVSFGLPAATPGGVDRQAHARRHRTHAERPTPVSAWSDADASARALAAALRAAGVDGGRARGPRRGAAPAARDPAAACPTPRSGPPRRPWPAPRRFVGHTSGATPLARARAGGRGRALRPPPAPDLRRLGRRRRRASPAPAVPWPAPRRRRSAVAAQLARALGMEPFEIDDERPRRLPRRRLDRLQLPGHARGGRRARWPPAAGLEPAEARALLAPLVRRTVENWAALGPRAGAHGPVARGDERDRRGAARGRGARPPRAARPSSTRWWSAPARSPGETVPA